MDTSRGVLRLAVTVLTALLVVLLVPPASQQTAEGRVYSLLARYRAAAETDPAIVILEAPAEVLAGSLEPDFYLTLLEMGAEKALSLLPKAPAGGAGAMPADQMGHFSERFEAEFGLVKKNVAALFDAIRFGSVRPQDAARFVEDLLVLIDEGEKRLLDDIQSSEARKALLHEKARSLFGTNGAGETPAEIGFAAPVYSGARFVPDYPRTTEGRLPFRRLPLEQVFRHARLESELTTLLVQMEDAGYLDGIRPELQPVILHSHGETLLYELLDRPGAAAKSRWLDERRRYIHSVNALLSGGTEAELDRGFAALSAEGQQDETQARQIAELRQNLANTFATARSVFADYEAVRIVLSRELGGSICITGSAPDPLRESGSIWLAPTEAESAAAQIQSVLTGRHSVIFTGWKEKAAIAAPGLVFAVLLSALSWPLALLVGFLAAAAAGAVCAAVYINTGVFVHPGYAALIPAAAMATTLIVSLLSRHTRRRQVVTAGGRRHDRKTMAAAGEDRTAPPVSRRSIILAVRAPLNLAEEIGSDGSRRAAALREFHSLAGGEVVNAGGVVVGAFGSVLLAGFGTPFDGEPSGGGGPKNDLNRALRAVSRLSGGEAGTPRNWTYGLDVGECTFYLSAANGYSVEGGPAVYARILSRLAAKYRNRVLVTEDVANEAGSEWSSRKLQTFHEKKSGRKRAFCALIRRPHA